MKFTQLGLLIWEMNSDLFSSEAGALIVFLPCPWTVLHSQFFCGSPAKEDLLLFPFYSWREWGAESQCGLQNGETGWVLCVQWSHPVPCANQGSPPEHRDWAGVQCGHPSLAILLSIHEMLKLWCFILMTKGITSTGNGLALISTPSCGSDYNENEK